MHPEWPELVKGFVVFIILLIIVVFVLCIVFALFYGIVEFLRNAFYSPPVYSPTINHTPIYYTPRPQRILAIDTEMVGAGDRGHIPMLARVSLVNKYGQCIYDEYVAPIRPVTDYRTFVSGIREKDLIGAKSFYIVQREVQDFIDDCILVGHDLKNDLNALSLTHPPQDIRDTALYIPIRPDPYVKPSLKFLAMKYLGRIIQVGEHSPIKDARAAMDIYLMFASKW